VDNIYKKSINDVYEYVDLTRNVRRFNNASYIDGYNDSVLDHTARVAFLSLEFAEYIKKEFNKEIDTVLLMRIALFHDLAEIETGDMSGPVKDDIPDMKNLLEIVDQEYLKRIFYKEFIDKIYDGNSLEYKIVKLADKFDVYRQMYIVSGKYHKKTTQYSKINYIMVNTMNKIKNMEVYNEYFKEYIIFDGQH
jgi:5'-deoxynucleotidase YfbR-like HD superfamily hydrolase